MAFFKAVLSIFFLFIPLIAVAQTCEECMDYEKQIGIIEAKRLQKDKDIDDLYKKRDYAAVTRIQQEIVNLSKEVSGLHQKMTGCKDACKPENRKRQECLKLMRDIEKLTDEGAPTKTIDDMYRNLNECAKDLTQYLKKD